MKQEEAARGDEQSQAGGRRVSRKNKKRTEEKTAKSAEKKFYRGLRKYKVLLIPNTPKFNETSQLLFWHI